MPPVAAHCVDCAAEIVPAGAKFCPRCGRAVVAPARGTAPASAARVEYQPHASVDINKLSAPIPWAGVAFLITLVLGPAAVIGGLLIGSKLLLYVGVALVVGLVVLLVLGMFF